MPLEETQISFDRNLNNQILDMKFVAYRPASHFESFVPLFFQSKITRQYHREA